MYEPDAGKCRRARQHQRPRNGGPAVVRIEDSKGGAEVYQMEFQWTGGFGNQARGSWAPDQAIENCRQAVTEQDQIDEASANQLAGEERIVAHR